VVVDDIDMEISHVIRGEDHIANTAKQILLYEALGREIPQFAHTPLILNQEGRKLSKRDGVTSIDDFRDMGFLPVAMANYMTLLGWTPPDSTQEIFSLQEASEVFSLERVNRAGAKFDWDKLDWINSQYLHKMNPEELVDLLIPYWQAAGYPVEQTEHLWLVQLTALIAPSLTRLTDAVAESRQIFAEKVNYTEEALQQLQQEGVKPILESLLAAITPNLSEEGAKEIINTVTKAQNVKKGVIMKSPRVGLMGELHGPDLIASWLLLNQRGWDSQRLEVSLGKI
jgi:glutamyl-tRNA synthetase